MPPSKKPRILYLRTPTQATFSAFVAGGLCASSCCDFEQYPPVPDIAWRGLQKTYRPAESLEQLNRHLLRDKNEVTEKLKSGWFDAVLLVDREASLCGGKRKSAFLPKLLGGAQRLFFSIDELNRLAPVAVVDFDDWLALAPAGQELLRGCSFYFKRELHFNRFFLYYPDRPSPWRKMREQILPLCGKARRLPLGIEDQKYQELQKLRRDGQDIDVFCCGQPTSTLRIRAAEELKKLASTTNWKIVVVDSMPFKEFCQHIARSKITVSVSGGGWDCFRHYEAAALGSLPLMDRPTIDTCWLDIAAGTFFFDSTFRNFQERIEFFLTCPERRSAALAAITQHVEQEMLHSKIVERIVAELLYEKNNHHRNNAPETAADHPG
ncbi:MAG: glycosyltransferase family protein [Candidatus Electronema sp. V4]|uniref:glycosyltransferase family protein n=1 Tax=Candidatus Electronema sp. V4 TaxID=3454756 RepID=UPI0040557F5A